MYKRSVILTCFIIFTFYIFSFLLLRNDYIDFTKNSATEDATVLTLSTMTATINGVSEEITLPYTFTDLEDRTEVILTATVSIPERYVFYIESKYTPLQIYLDNFLVYEYGQEGSFPASLLDPAETAQIVGAEWVYTTRETMQLTLIYQSPVTQNYFTVSPIDFGLPSSLYRQAFMKEGFPFLFGIALALVSVFLIFVACFIVAMERAAIRLLPLGWAGVMAGFWLVCSCDLTALLIDAPTWLYLISIYAMAAFPVPLIWFALSILHLRSHKFLFTVSLVEISFAIASIYLLHSGLVRSMIRVEQAFHIISPIAIILLAGYVLYEYITYHTASLQSFAYPAIIVALFTVLEILNNRFSFANLPVTFFQIGIMVFMFSMGLLGGQFMRDSLSLQTKVQQSNLNLQMMEYQATMLKKHSSLIIDTADDLRKQRHDLRHQLTAIHNLADKEDLEGLRRYLAEVMQRVPSEQFFYCNHTTINAILSHYASLCAKAGISLTIDVNIPPHSEIADTEFCVIFGNLLENAVEACSYLPEEKRQISIRSQTRYNNLLINMENSFDGYLKRKGSVFRSRKRDANGIGLSSIQSVAERHGGGVQFKTQDELFISYVYLSL